MRRRTRRRLWLPLLLGLAGLLVAAAGLFRLIGLGEAAVLLGAVALVFVVESLRYIINAFLAGYRRRR